MASSRAMVVRKAISNASSRTKSLGKVASNRAGVHTWRPTRSLSTTNSLKKQIEGTFISDGKSIHIRSAYGNKSVAYSDLGACIDHNSQVLLAQKLLSELARDPGSGKFKDLHQQKDDQQLEPMQKPFVGGASGWGSWN